MMNQTQRANVMDMKTFENAGNLKLEQEDGRKWSFNSPDVIAI
jgi:hypothetical protein